MGVGGRGVKYGNDDGHEIERNTSDYNYPSSPKDNIQGHGQYEHDPLTCHL